MFQLKTQLENKSIKTHANTSFIFNSFHITYNSRESIYGSGTTSIVFSNVLFFVLDGDHREQLKQIGDNNNWQACLDYFVENISKANRYSEHHAVARDRDCKGLAMLAVKLIGMDNVIHIQSLSKETSCH